jgi:hypothetical protein
VIAKASTAITREAFKRLAARRTDGRESGLPTTILCSDTPRARAASASSHSSTGASTQISSSGAAAITLLASDSVEVEVVTKVMP